MAVHNITQTQINIVTKAIIEICEMGAYLNEEATPMFIKSLSKTLEPDVVDRVLTYLNDAGEYDRIVKDNNGLLR